MASLSFIIRKVLSDIEGFCCLCLNSLKGNIKSFRLYDQVALNIDKTEEMTKIISTVLGDHILNNISSHIICQKCTEIAINSYRFIQLCRNNIQKLKDQIECLHNHTNNINDRSNNFKSLYLYLDTSKCNVVSYYDINQDFNCVTNPFERFKNILQESKQLFTNNEHESDNSKMGQSVDVRKKRNRILQYIKLSDIIYDKYDLDNYKCKTCLKLYPTGLKLKQHYLRVHAPKDFKCSQCPRKFGTLCLLNRHIKHSHCSVVCSQCGKTYTNTYSLRHHERSHKMKLVCETCGKAYKVKQALINHIKMQLCEKMRKSNSEAKFMCNYCGKKYAQKTALSVHIRLEHENGKALICDWCGKKHSSISRLRDHIITHTKQKNFECAQCGGKFVTKASLLYHTRTHTGEKPYKCDHCDMKFLSASRRSEHVKRNHATSFSECDICHGKFKGSTSLMRHRKRHFDVNCKMYKKPMTANEPPPPVYDGG